MSRWGIDFAVLWSDPYTLWGREWSASPPKRFTPTQR